MTLEEITYIEPIVDTIIEYLPHTTQLFIDKKRYNKISPIYHNAKNLIVRSIVYHRNRMNMIIEMDDEENLTLSMVRAHYILHYPDADRLKFYRHALDRKVKYWIPSNINLDLCNWKHTPKYLFKRIIMDMSLEEIFYMGW